MVAAPADQANPAASDPGSPPPGPNDDFGRDDAWEFLYRWRASKDLYSKECKKTHRLEERLEVTEAMLQGAEDALAVVKQQLAESDATVVGNLYF